MLSPNARGTPVGVPVMQRRDVSDADPSAMPFRWCRHEPPTGPLYVALIPLGAVQYGEGKRGWIYREDGQSHDGVEGSLNPYLSMGQKGLDEVMAPTTAPITPVVKSPWSCAVDGPPLGLCAAPLGCIPLPGRGPVLSPNPNPRSNTADETA